LFIEMAFTNYYIVLGVPNTASFEEIKAAYRGLAKKYHPDRNPGNKAAEDFFKEVQQAYSILSNPEKRKKFDLRFSYGNTQETRRKPAGTPYTGNAYQYAQQQNAYRQPPPKQPAARPTAKRPDKSENHYILISVGIAMVLLYFIISYSGTEKKDLSYRFSPQDSTTVANILHNAAELQEQEKQKKEEDQPIGNFESPYSAFFGEEVYDSDSKNSISISNSYNSEAVVCLVNNREPQTVIRNQYISAGSVFKMNNIPDGDYSLKIYFGNKWDPKKRLHAEQVKGGFREELGFFMLNGGKESLKMQQQHLGTSTSFSSFEITIDPYEKRGVKPITEEAFFN
jgi:curved DNA-binding protein CbpA